MGDEIRCAAEVDGQPDEGRALLETEEIVFRGRSRIVVKLSDIQAVRAADERLEIDHSGGRLVLLVGKRTEAWARKILHPKSRLDKLGIKTAVSLLGALPREFLDELVAAGVEIRADAPTIFLGLEKLDDLAKIPRPGPGGALWLVRPRGSDAVRERDVLEAGRSAGLKDVKVVRFSETHTADKFVLPKKPSG